eukprot:scaffold36637_cov45-Prasinocladus_malaysianus.AAC.2
MKSSLTTYAKARPMTIKVEVYRGPSHHAAGANELREELSSLAGGSLLDDADTYKDCEPLMLSTTDGTRFRLPAADDVATGSVDAASALRPTPQATSLTPAQLANQAVLAARAAISAYYAAPARSDDDVAPHESRDVCLRVLGSSCPGSLPASDSTSGATMVRTVTEAQLYTQLTHFHRLLDTQGALRRLNNQHQPADKTAGEEAEHRLSPLRKAYGGAASAVARLRDRCMYKWVDLGGLYGPRHQHSKMHVWKTLGGHSVLGQARLPVRSLAKSLVELALSWLKAP